MRSLFVSLFLLTVAFATPASAQIQGGFLEDVGPEAGLASEGGKPNTSIEETIGRVIQAVLGVLGIVFLLLTIYAGLLWMTAAGNDEKIAQAKKILSSSVVGLVIVLAAYAIASFVVTELSTATQSGVETADEG